MCIYMHESILLKIFDQYALFHNYPLKNKNQNKNPRITLSFTDQVVKKTKILKSLLQKWLSKIKYVTATYSRIAIEFPMTWNCLVAQKGTCIQLSLQNNTLDLILVYYITQVWNKCAISFNNLVGNFYLSFPIITV